MKTLLFRSIATAIFVNIVLTAQIADQPTAIVGTDRRVTISVPLGSEAMQFHVYARISRTDPYRRVGMFEEGDVRGPVYQHEVTILSPGSYRLEVVVAEIGGTARKAYDIPFTVP
jgi:hypothetical protein